MTLAEKLAGSKLPVVVQFHATWCGPCKALAPRVDAMEKEFAGQVDVVRIDVDQEPDIAKDAGVRGVPTLVAFKDGAEVRRSSGAMGAEGLRTFFRSALGEVSASEPVGKPAWHLAAKFGGGLLILWAAGRIPSIEWTRWIGFGLLFWAMRDFCPSCRTATPR